MAALGFLDVFSLISGGLGILQFGMDNFKAPDSVGSTIDITVGLDYSGGLSNAGGDLPDIRLFNQAGDFLGMSADPGSVTDGSMGEVKVSYNDQTGGQQAAYALFSANDNAICVAYITITWPDGNKYAWDGSWGNKCGGSWFYSNVFIKGSNVAPDCLWIDANGDQPQTGFQLHWPDFVSQDGTAPTGADADAKVAGICGDSNSGSPSFKMYTSPDPNSITYWVLSKLKRDSRYGSHKDKAVDKDTNTTFIEPDSKPKPGKLGGPQRQSRPGGNSTKTHSKTNNNAPKVNPHLNKLIISNHTAHDVERLCGSKKSVGPDFVNIGAGKFCRMEDKTLFPVCTDSVTDKCFNLDSKQLIVGGKAARATPYIDIGDWTTPNTGAALTKTNSDTADPLTDASGANSTTDAGETASSVKPTATGKAKSNPLKPIATPL